MRKKLGVLVFHRVTRERLRDGFSVDETEFRRILQVLQQQGTICGPEGVTAGERDGRASFLLTFDDGTADHYERVHPILAGHGIRGVFFVSTQAIGTAGHLTAAQVTALSAAGHTIGSHSVSHARLPSLSQPEIRDEVTGSVGVLERLTGRAVDWFAPPEGLYDARVVREAAASGIRYFRTTDYGWNGVRPAGTMQRLNTININAHFQAEQLRRSLGSRAVFLGFAAAFLVKNGLKKHAPLVYQPLRRLVERRPASRVR